MLHMYILHCYLYNGYKNGLGFLIRFSFKNNAMRLMDAYEIYILFA